MALGLHVQRLRDDPNLARRRAAGGAARAALNALDADADAGQVFRILCEFLAARTARAAGEITSEEAESMAQSGGASEDATRKLVDLFKEFEEARFAGGTASLDTASMTERVRDVVQVLEQEGV